MRQLAYNAVGEATHLETKDRATVSQTGAKVWFSETTASLSARRGARRRKHAGDHVATSTTGRGALKKSRKRPRARGCTTRAYEYDAEGNRTKQATRKPKSTGECAGTGEGEEAREHKYDEGDRLIDEDVEYDALGNTTHLSAQDSGGPEGGKEITSAYYVDNQVQSQTQNGTTLEDFYDPEGRVQRTISTSGSVHKEVISHYDGAGAAASWTCEATGEQCIEDKWTRKIPGIDGTLCAVQETVAKWCSSSTT